MPRFVILRHDSLQGAHFDFMLELGGALKTWALPQPPETGLEMECEALADHRLAYLDYEGPITGDRGSVTRWDFGECAIQRQSDTEWVVELAGQRINGLVTLCCVADVPGRWTLSFQQRTA